MTGKLRKALLVIAVTAGCFGAQRGTALAGSYVVKACSPSSSPGLWAETNSSPSTLVAGNQCGGFAEGPKDGSHRGALYAEDVLNLTPNTPDGSRAGWTFTAPASTTITAISYYRTLHAYNDSDMVPGLFLANAAPLEQCKIPWPFPSGSSIYCDRDNYQLPVTFSGLDTGSLFLGVICRIVTGALACIGGGTIHAARADMYSARVTLAENSTPTLDGVGGPLWAGAVAYATVPVTFAAADPSGIKDQTVRSDSGRTLASATQPCDFTTAPPCPQQPAGTLPVDTTRLPDGPHTFTLTVTDAAGDTQTATSPPVIIDNNGPPAPEQLRATVKHGASNVIALTWRNPPDPPAPITQAIIQLCQRSACSTPASIDPDGFVELPAPTPGDYGVRLWLLDAHHRGGPQNAALSSVNVPTSTVSPAKPRTKITAILTGRHLRVSGTIPRSGRVRVSWRSKLAHRTIGHGTRNVTIHNHTIDTTFTLTTHARNATTRVAIRSGRRVIAHARARRL